MSLTRDEPHYNPLMVRAEKITAGPVGKGTRLRLAVASMGLTAEMLIECTGYDRPKLFATAKTMRQADISYTLRFDPAGGGTRMRWAGEVRPKGVPAAGPADHLAGKPPGAADLGQPETALGTGLMVGVEMLAGAAWSCLSGAPPGRGHRPGWLSPTTQCVPSARQEPLTEEDCDPPAAATPVSRAR